MIKITRFFYIHPLVIILFLLSYWSGGIRTLLMAYGIVSVHELFHLFTALYLRERVGSIVVMPFGMTLRLSARIIRCPEKEMAIALAGPFSNLLMLCFAYGFGKFYGDSAALWQFKLLNGMTLLINLLPCLPLDGGRALKSLLVRRFGYLPALSFMRRLSRLLVCILLVLGGVLLVISRLNISLLLAAGFLAMHLTEERKESQCALLQSVLCEKKELLKKGAMRSEALCAMDRLPARKILRQLSYDRFYVIHITDEHHRYSGAVTEAELVEGLARYGGHISLGDLKKGNSKAV